MTSTTVAQPGPQRRARLPRFVLALPAWLWWAAFFAVPVLLVVAASFGSKIEGSAGRVSYDRLSLDNYRAALKGGLDGEFFRVLVQGLRTTVLGTLLCLVIAFPLAYLLATKLRRGKGLVLGLLAVPFFTNFLMRTLAWKIILAPKGLISNTLKDWGWIGPRGLDLLDTRIGVQIGVVYNYLPLMIFPLFVALDRLDPVLREASKDLFANRLKTFAQVTLPLARPGMIAGLVLVFVPLAGDYITANLLGGTKGNMPGNLVAGQFTQGQNPPLGAAIAVILVAMILLALAAAAMVGVAVAALGRVNRWLGAAAWALVLVGLALLVFKPTIAAAIALVVAVVAGLLAVAYGEVPERLGRVALWGWSALVLVFLYLPLAFIVAHSFNDNKSVEVWSRFSTKWYGSMWGNTQITGAVTSSFLAAAIASLIAVVLGSLAGIALARRPGKWTIGFMAIVLLVLTTPEIVDATGMQLQFVQLGGIFRSGLVPLWIGQSIFSTAVVTLIVRARMEGMDESLEQAANDLFATPIRAFREITVPLIAPAILAGGLLAFTFALDNVIISDFVKAPGTNTFPTYVFGLARTVRRPEINAMATILIGVTLLALLLAALVLRRSGEDSSKIAATLTGN
jgi:ABC-type spermidine/putrescine transport system permease subunit II